MDRAELERAIEAHHAASFGWALACCRRNRDEAEEVLQMTYLKVLDGKAQFDGRSSFKTWLFSVIRRTAHERFRWRAVRDNMLRAFALQPRPHHSIEYSDDAERVLRALRSISTRQREVLELVFYHDLTIEEAAQTLGISLGTARVHYHRGKRRLLQRLKEEGQVAFA